MNLPAQSGPKLSAFFTEIPLTTLDAGYKPLFKSPYTATADLNGDGNEDLVILGAAFVINGNTDRTPQPGRVFLGDGTGKFTAAPANLFPVNTLMTVNIRNIKFADFNRDGTSDMFLGASGWDMNVPSPQQGEQNRLFLSRSDGGWRDVTAELPQLEDYTHASAVGDIGGRGFIDIFVGNGFGGKNNILSYTLLNSGTGQFTRMSSNVPVGPGQILDTQTSHFFTGSLLSDLDGDGLAELVVCASYGDASQQLRNSVVLWNRLGAFSESDHTDLPAPPMFAFHTTHDAQRLDINGDGLQDLVLVGRQGGFNGWFVQLFINQGNHRFADETATRIPAGEWWGGVPGGDNNAPVPFWVRALDFNRDGFADFSVEWNFGGGRVTPEIPVLYINDGTGRFTTYKVGDLVAAGREFVLGGAHVMAFKNGYGFVTPQLSATTGLTVSGLVANKKKLPGVGR